MPRSRASISRYRYGRGIQTHDPRVGGSFAPFCFFFRFVSFAFAGLIPLPLFGVRPPVALYVDLPLSIEACFLVSVFSFCESCCFFHSCPHCQEYFLFVPAHFFVRGFLFLFL
uniref:Transmembrane protein n=1 Tax=Haemonchus contortus TaxID=6289 RepID=A0A7I5E660_HAECO